MVHDYVWKIVSINGCYYSVRNVHYPVYFKTLTNRIYKTILLVVLHGCKTGRLLWGKNVTCHRIRPSPRLCVTFRDTLFFYGEKLLAPRTSPSLRITPCRLSATALFNIFAATLHIWKPPLLSANRRCAVPFGQGPTLALNVTYEGVSKSFRTESITKYTLTTINAHSEATQRFMAAKLTRLTHKIAIQLHLVAKSRIICIFRSRRPIRKLFDTPSYKCLKTKCSSRYLNLRRTNRWAI
jgi:hypothetical protein